MLRAVGLSLVIALPASAAVADSFYARYLAPPCYTRTYDAAHLAAHPQQRVTSFYVVDSGPGNAASVQDFVVSFGFTVKDSGDVYASAASCQAVPQGVQCWVDGDGGTFTLEGNGGGLRVRVGDHLTVEGATSFSPDLGQGGDDKVILLYPDQALACRPF
ncbi:hypothetical protein [Bauldia sp.]|uniref:hypothetical protein n=1 Tax=Bauldia sp. TaxID=2575872 RepID=UPI003BAD507B